MHTHMQNINSLNKFKGMFCKIFSKFCTIAFPFSPCKLYSPINMYDDWRGQKFQYCTASSVNIYSTSPLTVLINVKLCLDHQNECWGPQDCLGITRRMLFDPSKLLLVFIHKSFALSSPPSLFPIPLQPQLSTSL